MQKNCVDDTDFVHFDTQRGNFLCVDAGVVFVSCRLYADVNKKRVRHYRSYRWNWGQNCLEGWLVSSYLRCSSHPAQTCHWRGQRLISGHYLSVVLFFSHTSCITARRLLSQTGCPLLSLLFDDSVNYSLVCRMEFMFHMFSAETSVFA